MNERSVVIFSSFPFVKYPWIRGHLVHIIVLRWDRNLRYVCSVHLTRLLRKGARTRYGFHSFLSGIWRIFQSGIRTVYSSGRVDWILGGHGVLVRETRCCANHAEGCAWVAGSSLISEVATLVGGRASLETEPDWLLALTVGGWRNATFRRFLARVGGQKTSRQSAI